MIISSLHFLRDSSSWYASQMIYSSVVFPSYIKGSILYTFSRVLLLSISIMPLRFVHVVTCHRDRCILIARHSPLGNYTIVQPLYCWCQFSLFPLWDTYEHSCTNILVYMSTQVSLGYKPGVELLGHRECPFPTSLTMPIYSPKSLYQFTLLPVALESYYSILLIFLTLHLS